MNVRVELDGLAELKTRLFAVTAEVRDEIIQEALMAAAEVIRPAVVSRAPVGKTGTLRDNVFAVPGDKKRPSVRVGVGLAAFYAVFVERGTKPRVTRKTKANRGAMPARPFLRPAVDATKQAAGQAAAAVVMRRLRDV